MTPSSTDVTPFAGRAATALRLGKAVRLVWSASPRLCALGLALWLALGVLPPLTLLLLKRLVDAVAASDRAAGLSAVVLLGLVALLSACGQSAAGLLSEAQAV